MSGIKKVLSFIRLLSDLPYFSFQGTRLEVHRCLEGPERICHRATFIYVEIYTHIYRYMFVKFPLKSRGGYYCHLWIIFSEVYKSSCIFWVIRESCVKVKSKSGKRDIATLVGVVKTKVPLPVCITYNKVSFINPMVRCSHICLNWVE